MKSLSLKNRYIGHINTVTSSTVDIFFEITKFSKILSKLTLFSKILSKFDKIFENFRKKCQFRKYFRKFCNFEKSAMVNEVNITLKMIRLCGIKGRQIRRGTWIQTIFQDSGWHRAGVFPETVVPSRGKQTPLRVRDRSPTASRNQVVPGWGWDKGDPWQVRPLQGRPGFEPQHPLRQTDHHRPLCGRRW